MKDGILQQIGTPDDIYRQPGQYLRGRLHWLADHEFHRLVAHRTPGASGLFSFAGGST
jgi:hypothetical protein